MSEPAPTIQQQPRQFPCKQCGASLVFAPGTRHLKCQYCGTDNEIAAEAGETEAEERDFLLELERLDRDSEHAETLTVRCDGCGAESTLEANRTAGACVFCGRPLVAQAHSRRVIKPSYLLPFGVTAATATASFRTWIAGLWFAPGDLKTYADRGGLKGVYLPAWTYDCETSTRYTGQRGDDYWTTESYTTVVNGRSVTRTRQVRRTRWSSASGRVENSFDDVLVMASHSLPETCSEKLTPWDLKQAVPYKDEYLAGFVAESYQVGLAQGFEGAKGAMAGAINARICRDIGGDHQRVTWTSTKYSEITFKHLLLPVWLSSYRYKERTFRFVVNARTGEVWGERPYSAWKITGLVLAILAALGVIAMAMSARGGM